MDGPDIFAASIGAIAGGAFVWIFKDRMVNLWQHMVAWFHGAQSYAAVLEARAQTLVNKANAIRAAAVTAASKP